MQNGSKNEKLVVLVVEDDEDDFVLTKSLLDEIGDSRFDVEWAKSYEDALDKMAGSSCHFDVCLLDYRLGAQTGLELLKDARGRGSKCPSILLTGQGAHEIDIEATLAGASDYLVKGDLNALKLERSIRYAVQQRQIEEERIQHLLVRAADAHEGEPVVAPQRRALDEDEPQDAAQQREQQENQQLAPPRLGVLRHDNRLREGKRLVLDRRGRRRRRRRRRVDLRPGVAGKGGGRLEDVHVVHVSDHHKRDGGEFQGTNRRRVTGA
jgi:DNA-binding response OmpR family regulator